MPSAGRAKPVTAIICDDIRRESNGKDILIGVYSGDIILQTFPANLLVGLYIIFSPERQGEIHAKIKFRGVEDLFGFEGVLHILTSEGPSDTVSFGFSGLPLFIEKPAPISIYYQHENEEWELVRTIGVQQLAELPTSGHIPRLFGTHAVPVPPRPPEDNR